MFPERAGEALKLDRERRDLISGKNIPIPPEVRDTPWDVLNDLVARIEARGDYYDAGFDHGHGNATVTTRVKVLEGDVSVVLALKYADVNQEIPTHKVPAKGSDVVSLTATYGDPKAVYPEGHLSREHVDFADVSEGNPSEDVLRQITLLQQTVESLPPAPAS